MRKLWLSAWLLATGLLAMANWPEGVTVDEFGATGIGNQISINWMSYQDKDWKSTAQNRQHFIPRPDGVQSRPGDFRWAGEWHLHNHVIYQFKQQLVAAERTIRYTYEMATPGRDKALLVVNCAFQGPEIAGKTVTVNGETLTIPAKLGDWKERRFDRIRKIVFDGTNFRTTFEGDFSAVLMVTGNALRMRILTPQASDGKSTRAELAFAITVEKTGVGRAVEAVWDRLPKEHPRLVIKELFDERRTRKDSPLKQLLRQAVIEDADNVIKLPVHERKMDDPMRMLNTARWMQAYLVNLASAYALTGDRKYVERGLHEMKAAAAFSDWNPDKHYLDTAELTMGMALAYDAFYPVMSPEDRKLISTAIREKGLKPSLLNRPSNWWRSATNNWSQVCHGGMVAGAVATYEDDPELAKKVVANAIEGLTYSTTYSYSPNGAYPEGCGYWGYATNFGTMILDIFDRSFGTCFGLDKIPGMDRTADYFHMQTGPSGFVFNCADSGTLERRGFSFAMFQLAKRYNRPDLLIPWELGALEKTLKAPRKGRCRLHNFAPFILVLMPEGEIAPGSGKLHYYSGDESNAPVGVIRSEFGPDAGYLAMTAGRGSRNHGHMDCGGFVYDVLGERFAMDLGADDYARLEKVLNLWDHGQQSARWSLFRYGEKSHNIPLIDQRPQNVAAGGKITAISDHAITADLSGAYIGQAAKVTRHAEFRAGNTLVLQDSFAGLKPGSALRFQWCTAADAALDADGGVVLTRNGKSVRLSNDVKGRWEIAPEEQFFGPNDRAVKGIKVKMVTFTIPAPAADWSWRVKVEPIKAR